MKSLTSNSHAPLSATAIAGMIDHTLLKPDATRDDVRALCGQASSCRFAAVCVNAWYVAAAREFLRGSQVKVATVVGFPLGATLPQAKAYEAREALKLGAQEIDMVLNIGALKSGEFDAVESDIHGVVEVCHRQEAICKVILETALLTNEEKARACAISKSAGADFVKTSTGFSSAGAKPEDVALMRAAVGPGMGVKAAGGIRNLADLEEMVRAGATRIGTSGGVLIVQEAKARQAAPKQKRQK